VVKKYAQVLISIAVTVCLLFTGCKPPLSRDEKFSALVTIADAQTVQKAIDEGADVNYRDERGDTPLLTALWVSQGMQNFYKTTLKDEAGLMRERHKLRANVQVLLKAKADPTARRKDGETAFDYAKWMKDDQILQMLNEAQSDKGRER